MKLFKGPRFLVPVASCVWILAGPPAGGSAGAAEPSGESVLPFAACFAPGTPTDLVQRHAERQAWGSPGHSLSATSGTKYQFQDVAGWNKTAVDGSGLAQGAPTTLTWSVVPDGTSVYGYNGEPTSPSNLRAFLNGIYGSQAVWLAVFEQVFDRWGELTGIDYVYEPNDDGSPFTSISIASGQLGVRGDIRIAGHPLDGSSGVLAYNFFPDLGDMILDTSDSFFTYTGNNSLGLRNTLAHEHGHGLGLSHVCPIDQSKLMEPYITFAFDGPQHDDALAANRGYGDHDEDNDSPGTARSLSPLGAMATLDRSIDDDSDVDFYSFHVAGGAAVSITLSPVGSTYSTGPQSQGCANVAPFDSRSVHDLYFRVLDTDGSTVLATVDLAPAGGTETLNDFAPGGPGNYVLEVSGEAGTNAAQLYRLEIGTGSSDLIFQSGFESGDWSQWN